MAVSKGQRFVQRGGCWTQASPTFEQLISPAADFRQVRQLSVHSTQLASGGANADSLAGAACGADWGSGVTSRSAAGAATGRIRAAAKSQAMARRVMPGMVPSPVHRVEQP
jgi:hypothetical protein